MLVDRQTRERGTWLHSLPERQLSRVQRLQSGGKGKALTVSQGANFDYDTGLEILITNFSYLKVTIKRNGAAQVFIQGWEYQALQSVFTGTVGNKN